MLWPRQFVAVPTRELRFDQEVFGSSKASSAQISAYAARLPEVFARLRAGAMEDDFKALRRAPEGSRDREVADVYFHMFSPKGFSHRVEAEYTEEHGLVVQRGHHRVLAAKELSLGYVPVHVRAADQATLDRLTQGYRDEMARVDPDVVRSMGALENAHQRERDNAEGVRTTDINRQRGRERSR